MYRGPDSSVRGFEKSSGAPVWMTTFSDLVTLLLCFFVFMFSFADLSVTKFTQISGSMKNSFGMSSLFAAEPGAPLFNSNFLSSSSWIWATSSLRTENVSDLRAMREDFLRIQQTLASDIAAKRVQISAEASRISLHFHLDEAGSLSDRLLAARTITAALKRLSLLNPAPTTPIIIAGATPALMAFSEAESTEDDAVTLSAVLLESAFINEIRNGLITVQRKEGALLVKIGEGGAFATGDTKLTPLALELIGKVGALALSEDARIIIGGHTDNTPINTSRYRDNWDLSVARSTAVVRELVSRWSVDPKRIQAQGFGDTRPTGPNDTAEHRVLNRRIEIEIQWPKK